MSRGALGFVAAFILTLALLPNTVRAQSESPPAQAEIFWQQCLRAHTDALALPPCLRAANSGHPRGMGAVAMLYHEGHGIRHDPALARYWGEKAAALGNRGAMYLLGMIYEEADGVPQDLPRAAAFYERSARLGFSKAQFAVGLSYEFGEGVVRDRQQAIYWLSQAAAQGDGRAGWIAEWLGRSDTPRFANEDQLASYINGRVASAYQFHSTPGPGGCGGVSWVCQRQADQQRWRSEYHPPNTPNPFQ